MACRECASQRLVSVSGKCSDLFTANTSVLEYSGYVPSDINIGGDDYIDFQFCLECGMIQDDFPVQSEVIVACTVSDFYEGNVCPDCGATIPEEAVVADTCENCGHIFSIDNEVLPKGVTLIE